jgi:hypothetical protein
MYGWSAASAPSKVPVDRNSTVRGKSRAIAASAAGGVDRPRPQVGLGHAEASAAWRRLDGEGHRYYPQTVAGFALDAVNGEVWQRKLCHNLGEVLRWISGLPDPVKVCYQASPTEYGLYRHLNDHGTAAAEPVWIER